MWNSWKLMLIFPIALRTLFVDGCGRDYPFPPDNQPPIVRLANAPPDDPALDTSGYTGLWNAGTDDIGRDGLRDDQEVGCLGTFDGIWNPDPAFDNFDPYGMDLCPPDSGIAKSDRVRYTENNGRPDPGEPNVSLPRPFRSSRIRLDWSGLDQDGYITAFRYRWTYKEHYADSIYQVRPWVTVINHVTAGFEKMVLMLDVPDMNIAYAALSVHSYFTWNDLYPRTANPAGVESDSGYAGTIRKLSDGDTVIVNGYRVFASNPLHERYPVHETPYAGTFTFESNDFLNHHTFEIQAIDNEKYIGPPDTLRFWTPQVEPPRVTIAYSYGQSPDPRDTVYILPSITKTWQGVKFTFTGSDRNSRTIFYSWKIDSGSWSPFVTSNVARVTAADLDTPYTGRHSFCVRAKNEFGAITPDSMQPVTTFNTIHPEFTDPGYPWRVLLVSINRKPAVVTPGDPDESQVMQYYDQLFTSLNIPHDMYNPRGTGHPSIRMLARYKTVYLITDNIPPGDSRMLIPSSRYAAYTGAGGTMLMNVVAWSAYSVVFSSTADLLLVDRFQLADLRSPEAGGSHLINREFDCVGAFGDARTGYPRLEVDPAKCDTFFTSRTVAYNGALRRCYITQPQGFADVIYRFDSKVDSVDFENKPMGIRYMGATYRTVWFGISLYFVKEEQARAAIRKGMEDLGYQF